MDEILDEIQMANPREIYSKLAFLFSMLALTFLLFISYNCYDVDHNITKISTATYVSMGIFFFSFPVGIAMKIMSFVTKEPANRFRMLGFFFSIVVLCYFLLSIYFEL